MSVTGHELTILALGLGTLTTGALLLTLSLKQTTNPLSELGAYIFIGILLQAATPIVTTELNTSILATRLAFALWYVPLTTLLATLALKPSLWPTNWTVQP